MRESRPLSRCGTSTISRESLTILHRQFEATLPALRATLHFRFRTWPSSRRAEAIADALAACWHCWHGLARRGKDPMTIGATGIANNAVRYVLNGRRLGTATGGRGMMDVFNPKAQRKLGVTVVSLDRPVAPASVRRSDAWRDWAAVDNRMSPADEACFRIDFSAWLSSLPPRKREMAELLIHGHETGIAATMLGVTPAAVSITRGWLERSWRAFQGEAVAPDTPPVRRPRGRPRTRGRTATQRRNGCVPTAAPSSGSSARSRAVRRGRST